MKLRSILKMGLVLIIAISSVLSIAGCGGGEPVDTAQYLIVQSDTVTGSGCFQTNWAHRGELFVIRARVIDPVTNEDMDDTLLESVTWKLANGENISLHYGEHGDVGDMFWASAWEVPLDFPTGSFTYTLEAVANDGRTGSYGQFLVDNSVMKIVEYDSAFVARRSVNIENNLFDPSVITVTQGGAVRWRNRDAVDHAVVGEGFDTGVIATDARVSQVFAEAGTFEVHCSIHPAETGTVIVQAP